ncbi:hypothetical protein Ddye_012598 [Dipteronia dyeriana]|uniref:Uncharacterized protein n=1 Tax=Dipteronia dyeriana TaxID=168575 RepID=A0AAD9X4S1_9ROSI|nr:hypothetical protein Ddye_012598 [Dipteronia dyeriana]
MNGKVQLPLLKYAPNILHNLQNRSKHFLSNLRAYKMMFSFTSFGVKVDTSINKGSNPPTFRIKGHNHHYMGGLIPLQSQKPKFAQLYIHGTEDEINKDAFDKDMGQDKMRRDETGHDRICCSILCLEGL